MIVSSSKEFDIDTAFTGVDLALETLRERQKDTVLRAAIEKFLSDDIPDCMVAAEPTFYFPRHIATPSYETLHAIDLARSHRAKLLIGQDVRGKYVTHNELKLPLGKLRFTCGTDRHGQDITISKAVIDFQSAAGQPMAEIVTRFGVSLPEFHNKLLEPWIGKDVIVFDESKWIDRWARTDITRQYERMFAFACLHTVMIEWFTASEFAFAHKIMLPAFKSIEIALGVKPMMVSLMCRSLDKSRNWNAYPPEAFQQFDTMTGVTSASRGR
jgi:hypothetical protein